MGWICYNRWEVFSLKALKSIPFAKKVQLRCFCKCERVTSANGLSNLNNCFTVIRISLEIQIKFQETRIHLF